MCFFVVRVVFIFVCICYECLPEVLLPGRCYVFVCVCCECLAGVLFSRGAVPCLCTFVVNAWLGPCFPGRCFMSVRVCRECLAGVSSQGDVLYFVIIMNAWPRVSFLGRCFMLV